MEPAAATQLPAPRGWRLRRLASRGAVALLAVYLAVAVVRIARTPDVSQVNFRVYYYAALALERGLNPYDTALLGRLAGGQYVMNCGYPPLMLNLFRPFLALDYLTASYLFLAVKTAALLWLLWWWQRRFLQRPWDPVFLALCLVGFNFTLWFDVQAGNITVFEQAVLWYGFWAYTQGRLNRFAVCVALAASVKLTPVVFLALLLLEGGRVRWKALAIGTAVFAAIQGASLLVYPALTLGFLNNVQHLGGMVSVQGAPDPKILDQAPATWPLIRALLQVVASKAGVAVPSVVPVLVFGAVVLSILAATFLAWRRAGAQSDSERRTLQVMLACLVYLLVVPRLLPYSYILGLLPAYYVARRLKTVDAIVVVLCLAAFSTTPDRPTGFSLLYDFLPGYYPLLLTYFLWALLLLDLLGYLEPTAVAPDEAAARTERKPAPLHAADHASTPGAGARP